MEMRRGDSYAPVQVPHLMMTMANSLVTATKQHAFSALTVLVWHRKEHPARKKLSDEVLAWLSVCSQVQMICIWSS